MINKALLLLTSISVMAFSSTTLHAEQEKDDSGGLGDLLALSLTELINIKISLGSLFEENRFTSGATTELFTKKEWQKTTSMNIWEVINHQPGMMMPHTTTGGRGISVRGILLNPGVRGIATMIDGIPINNLSYSTGFYHLENPGLAILDKIEMLRGPGSSIYGADAFQGVLSFSTAQYTEDKFEVQGTAGLGDYFQQSFNYGKRFNDKVTLSVAADNSSKRDDLDFEYGLGAGSTNPVRTEKERYTVPIKTTSLAATLNTQLTNKLNLETGVIGNISSRDRSHRYVLSTDQESSVDTDSSFGLIRATALYDLNDNTTLNAKAYYWSGEYDWFFHSNGYNIKHTNSSRGFDANIKQENDKFNTKWALGYTYSYTEVDEAQVGISIVSDSVEDYSRKLNSVYVDARTSFFDGSVDVLYGVRFDRYSDFGEHTSPRLGLIYYPDESSAVKLTYSNAFRSPAANEIGTNPLGSSSTTFGNPDIEPEVLDTYELVYMNSFGDSHFEGTLFYTELTDVINTAPMPTSHPHYAPNRKLYQNLGGVRSKGIETKFSTTIKGVKSDLSASWVSSESSEAGINYDGFPNWIINGRFSYELPKYSTTITLDNRLELGRKTYQRTSSSQDATDLDDLYRADLNITKNFSKKLVLSLNVTNLFDNDDLHAVNVIRSESLISLPGRSAFLRARYTW